MVYFERYKTGRMYPEMHANPQGKAIMGNVNGLSKEELKAYILEQIRDLGIDVETIEVDIGDGPVIILRGKVDSASERGMINQTIMDLADIEEVIDELVVVQGVSEGLEDQRFDEKASLYDEDEECVGTEDAFRSVADGVPYIPPSKPTYQGSSDNKKWKRKKKQKS
jgi:hypothetical protein